MGQNEQRSLVVAIAVLAFSTLMLASAPRWAACISAALAVLAVIPLAGSRRRLLGPSPLLWLLLVPLIATSVQLLPWPSGLVRLIAPASYELAQANANAYGSALPSFLPLSQDWPATLVELAKFAGYVAFAYVCLRLSVSRRARRWLQITVAIVGVIVAVCALGHRAFGAKSLLGLYTPSVAAYSNSLSPFLNPNQLAGYMAFVTPLCLGLAFHRKSWIFFGLAIVCAFAGIQANSRGGSLSMSVGILSVLLLYAWSQRRTSAARHSQTKSWLAVGVGCLFIGLIIFGATAGQDLLRVDLQQEQEAGKILAWRSAPDLLATSPWVGIGRGAFEFSYTSVQPPIGVTFSHIENEYIQTVLDWGIPTAIAILVALLLLLRALFRRGVADGLAAGGLAAIAALLIQSFYDFGLEFAGMGLPAIAITATLLDSKLAIIEDKVKRKRIVWARMGAAMVAVVLCALGASSLGARPNQDIALHKEFDSGFSGDAEAVLAKASKLAERHPSSYLVHAKAAEALGRLRSPLTFRVLARALDQNPKHFGVHLLAAHLLGASQEPRQAIAEYRAALTLPGGNKRKILESGAARFPAADDLVLIIPIDAETHTKFGGLFMRMQRADAAELLAKHSMGVGNTSIEIYELGISAALQNGHTSWATSAGLEIHTQHQSTRSLLLYVAALRASSLPLVAIEAFAAFKPADEESEEGLEALAVLCALQLEVKDYGESRKTAETLLRASGESMKHRKAAHLHLATIEEHYENKHQATWHRQQAADLRQR